MYLKRIFIDGEASVQDCMRDVTVRGKPERQFDHTAYLKAGGDIRVEVKNLSKEWHVSSNVLEKGVTEGYFVLGGGQLRLRAPEGQDDVVFDIVSPPVREQGKHYYDCRVVES